VGLLDIAPRLLPELDGHLSATADRVLRRRGVEVRTGQSVTEARPNCVRLSDGESITTHSLIWCVGVRPDPLISRLALPVSQGRLAVDEFLAVPGAPGMYACGDCAAVPGRAGRSRQPAGRPAVRASRERRYPRLSAAQHARQPGTGTGRLDRQRRAVTAGSILRPRHIQGSAARRAQAASLRSTYPSAAEAGNRRRGCRRLRHAASAHPRAPARRSEFR
jgi:NADH dehydrogenase